MLLTIIISEEYLIQHAYVHIHTFSFLYSHINLHTLKFIQMRHEVPLKLINGIAAFSRLCCVLSLQKECSHLNSSLSAKSCSSCFVINIHSIQTT